MNVFLLVENYKCLFQKQSHIGVLKTCTPMPKCDLNKVVSQLYKNHTLEWVFSCKFAESFQNTFSKNTSGWPLAWGERSPQSFFQNWKIAQIRNVWTYVRKMENPEPNSGKMEEAEENIAHLKITFLVLLERNCTRKIILDVINFWNIQKYKILRSVTLDYFRILSKLFDVLLINIILTSYVIESIKTIFWSF